MVKNLPANAGATGDVGSILGLGRSSGGGKGNPLQCSCQDNLTVHGVAELAINEQLSTHTIYWFMLVRKYACEEIFKRYMKAQITMMALT